MEQQYYILQMSNFTKEEAEAFLGKAFGNANDFDLEQEVWSSPLNKSGVGKLKNHTPNQKEKTND